MKAKPILFSTPLAQALLEGRKTQTRRIIKHPRGSFVYFENNRFVKSHALNDLITNPNIAQDFCPYGGVGDLLWVRETFSKDLDGYIYKASCPWWDSLSKAFNKPSIFMPRLASRLTLEITNIRVERLQDISEKDAEAEGIESFMDFGNKAYKDYTGCFHSLATARASFKSLWIALNRQESWTANPWVWCVEFKAYKCNVNNFKQEQVA